MRKNTLLNLTQLENSVMEKFNLSQEEAAIYVKKWEEIFAEKIRSGWSPAFIMPKSDGSVDIEIYGHKIVDEK